jgi:phosphate-selective porin OprO/OprP
MKAGFGVHLVLTALLAGPLSATAEGDGIADAGPQGFALGSAEENWKLRVRGLLHLDGRAFADDSAPDNDNEWLLRRLRLTFEGSFGERIELRLTPDFGGGDEQIVDAWVDTRLGGGISLRAGKFKPPVGLERLQSAGSLRLVERSIVTELVPNRDIGVQLSGGGERLTWAVGIFNGVDDGRSGDQDDDGNQEVAVRLFGEPFKSNHSVLGLGVGASYGSTEGNVVSPLLSGYRSPGQNTIFLYRIGTDGTFADGERLRVSPQFYWYQGALGLLGEWVRVSQQVRRTGAGVDRSATLDHEAWQIMGEWFVTGEQAGFRDPGAAAGAVQLVARLSRLTIDADAFTGGDTSFANPAIAASAADTWAVGVNWFPIEGLKSSLVYQRTSFDGGGGASDRPDEKVFFFRMQHGF